MIVRLRRLAGACVLVVLASCSGDAEPATLPDLTPTPTVTGAAAQQTVTHDATRTEAPTPTPGTSSAVDPPVEPAMAHDYSVEGVEAFTQYAIDVINYIYLADDISYLEQIMTPDCTACRNWVEMFEERKDAGTTIDGGLIVADFIDTPGPAQELELTSVAVDVTVTASRTLTAAGATTNSAPDRQAQLLFDFLREGESWKLHNVRIATESSS